MQVSVPESMEYKLLCPLFNSLDYRYSYYWRIGFLYKKFWMSICFDNVFALIKKEIRKKKEEILEDADITFKI